MRGPFVTKVVRSVHAVVLHMAAWQSHCAACAGFGFVMLSLLGA